MALPLPLPFEDTELAFDLPKCARCSSGHLRGEVCSQCGLCQVCGEIADDCICELHAYDRYIEADYQEWEDARYT